METNNLLDINELSRSLGAPPERLRAIANQYQLPFSVITGRGFVISKRDFDYWRSVVNRAQADC
jgi:hypothetical protein